MKVLVYVEGPSDRDGLAALLRSVVDAGRSRGVGISFHPQRDKDRLMERVPRLAATHLAQHPEDLVVALPDLYPLSSAGANAHSSFGDLRALLQGRFSEHAATHGMTAFARTRFKVHCLKHDLEVLLLAVPDVLRARLGTEDVLGAWRIPVEEQNNERPPKRVVERLFMKYLKRRYVEDADAVWILSQADLTAVERACPQCFAPFVVELRAAGGY